MRIPIREQLGLLVLLTSLIALAVVAIATWVNNYNFVLGIRSSGLSLTASLKAAQLSSNLLLLQSTVNSVATRVLPQLALQRYYDGNNTDANWARSAGDLQGALAGGGGSALLLQAIIYSKNGTGTGNPFGLLNVTGYGVNGKIQLPYNHSNGSSVYLGDDGLGYPPELYPNLTYTSTPVNSSYNLSTAYINGAPLGLTSAILYGPWQVNASFALLSLTVPIINNTSLTDILGYITVLIDARLIYDVFNSYEGLDNTGSILFIGPSTTDNKFANGTLAEMDVIFLLPPAQNASRGIRHSTRAFGQRNTPFPMKSYPAVLDAYTKRNAAVNNAGSLISTRNEEGDTVSVGYARPSSALCNWALLVEFTHGEVVAPINHLRNVLVACVFGTAAGILLLLFPIAHFSVRPIRRLRAATEKTVQPVRRTSDNDSLRSLDSRDDVLGDEENLAREAKKEGFIGQLSGWRRGRPKTRARHGDDTRRQSFRIPGKVEDRNHFIHDELTDLTKTYNEMSEELMMQYARLEERVQERTQELEVSKKAAEAANESKTLFIANISHELKTPLNGILGMCAVCMSEDDPTRVKRSLGIIYKSGDLLLHLLTDLLTFSKNQIGQQLQLDEREFRLADISSQVMSIFDKQAKDGNINLGVTFQGPQDKPDLDASGSFGPQPIYGPFGTGRVKDMYLYGDQHRILQVIINLVSNSLKFTPPGGSVDLRIRCLGEALERANSRKDSMQSKYSKDSRQSRQRSGRPFNWKHRPRLGSGKNSNESDTLKKKFDTALTLKASQDNKHHTQLEVDERSPSPSPVNMRTLLFEFEVEDTGPGVPEHLQERVFEPFVQGDLGLSKKYGGTGLGLSICSQLAGLMKGSITLRSQQGVGSTFNMRIPLRYTRERADSTASSTINLTTQHGSLHADATTDEPGNPPVIDDSRSNISITSAHDNANAVGFDTTAKPRLVGLSQPFFTTDPALNSPTEQMAAIERVAAEASKRGDKIRVLVAEDNKVNQEVVLRMLKLEDIYDVTVAKDGQEAFDMVKESMEKDRLFNLIFMDIQVNTSSKVKDCQADQRKMPNVDGLQSTRLIRQMGYSAPIVALTAFAEESNVKECMDSGMNYFLSKPIRRPALKQVLKTYCATIPEAEEGGDAGSSPNQRPTTPDAVSPFS
ncbi:MAG: Histidine kinase [Candelina mexicana]|nr:MAG: Histidine kinase [Candelina mexicana]